MAGNVQCWDGAVFGLGVKRDKARETLERIPVPDVDHLAVPGQRQQAELRQLRSQAKIGLAPHAPPRRSLSRSNVFWSR